MLSAPAKLALMVYDQFKIGFWHPFGQHGQESPESIIDRKREEIRLNGWTLWSFQHRRTLEALRQEILAVGDPPIFVFCSDSPKDIPSGRSVLPAIGGVVFGTQGSWVEFKSRFDARRNNDSAGRECSDPDVTSPCGSWIESAISGVCGS
jgi:hypothetical protein